MIRFPLVFGLLTVLNRSEPFITNVSQPYCEILARSLELAFSLAGLDPERSGATISVRFGTGLTVIPSCDGLILLFLFVSGVAAMPIQRSLRPYLRVGVYLSLLVVINWFRLVLLALTCFYQPNLFAVMHSYVMQGLLVFAVVTLFFVWLFHPELKRSVGV